MVFCFFLRIVPEPILLPLPRKSCVMPAGKVGADAVNVDGSGLLKIADATPIGGIDGKTPLYLTLPGRLVRAEMENGRVRW